MKLNYENVLKVLETNPLTDIAIREKERDYVAWVICINFCDHDWEVISAPEGHKSGETKEKCKKCNITRHTDTT
jgi:hypothetical protein